MGNVKDSFFQKYRYVKGFMICKRLASIDPYAAEQVKKRLIAEKKMPYFFGDWIDKYKRMEIPVALENDLFRTEFAISDGTKMPLYILKDDDDPWLSNEDSVREVIRNLLIEQDIESPHFYFTQNVMEHATNGTILDIGAAEGNFSLFLSNKIKKTYLFEANSKWNKALNRTFSNTKSEFEIINSFVSDVSNQENNTISIDEYFARDIPEDISIIKIDIEGFEQKCLKGMKNTLEKNPNAILLICAYHTQYAEEEIRSILTGYQINPRKNKMLFYDKSFAYPYLRTGVIEAHK